MSYLVHNAHGLIVATIPDDFTAALAVMKSTGPGATCRRSADGALLATARPWVPAVLFRGLQ